MLKLDIGGAAYAALIAASIAVSPYAAIAQSDDDTIIAIEEDGMIDVEGAGIVITVEGEANGTITIDLFEEVAPLHVDRILTLADNGDYDGVVFHRVIDGFMAQTGDVEFGIDATDLSRAGMGGSEFDDLPAEFSELSFERGVIGMARSANPDSANSQFFIMFAPAPHLNGQYTIVGEVVEGLDVLDEIKRGLGGNGAMIGVPDMMSTVTVIE